MNKHNHCYPNSTSEGIISNGTLLKCKADIERTCMCTMQELCKALVTIEDERSRESIIKCIHKMIDDQKDLKF